MKTTMYIHVCIIDDSTNHTCMCIFCLAEDPSLSSPLKKRPSSAGTCSNTLQGGQNGTASLITSVVSLKSELYDAPRRSLRQKGLVPEQKGFPYYSPSKPRRTLPHDNSNTVDSSGEGVSEGLTSDGEQSGHETNKDDVTIIVEDDDQAQRRASTRKGKKLGARENNVRESLEPRRDDSAQQEETKPNQTAASSSSATAAEPLKEVRVLTNSHARRQIIRPWEDNSNNESVSLQVSPPVQLYSASQKKHPLSNFSATTPLTSAGTRLQDSLVVDQRQRNDSDSGKASSSVQTAAEALVEIGQLTSSASQGNTVESMELETKSNTRTLSSVDSVMEVSSASPVGTGASLAASGPEAVVIDRKRQLSLFNRVAQASGNSTIEQMDRLHSTFEHIVFRHRMAVDKHNLIEVSYILTC